MVYNWDLRDEFKGDDFNSFDDDIQVFVIFVINLENSKVYMGSYIEGLVEVDFVFDEIIVYNMDNFIL